MPAIIFRAGMARSYKAILPIGEQLGKIKNLSSRGFAGKQKPSTEVLWINYRVGTKACPRYANVILIAIFNKHEKPCKSLVIPEREG